MKASQALDQAVIEMLKVDPALAKAYLASALGEATLPCGQFKLLAALSHIAEEQYMVKWLRKQAGAYNQYCSPITQTKSAPQGRFFSNQIAYSCDGTPASFAVTTFFPIMRAAAIAGNWLARGLALPCSHL